MRHSRKGLQVDDSSKANELSINWMSSKLELIHALLPAMLYFGHSWSPILPLYMSPISLLSPYPTIHLMWTLL